jgi:hypothetical protein
LRLFNRSRTITISSVISFCTMQSKVLKIYYIFPTYN